ncbi:hypothetical protein [Aquimarina brevivitae]|uniref:Uncharacterized protein n=1 Tax=Aquimarina brevivitae TaxID=323412 RepID=A0A4Q7PHE8_9FLAO|nr:hypothetical protein [Aquimarina brevivitae]RZS99991.1 hypothetical protein EV197_1222 [Aquimarina brevivitae]
MCRIFFVSFLMCAVSSIFLSCQDEEEEQISSIPEETNAIKENSELSKLMQKVTLHDGSFDDIVDESNCFSINIPYTIFRNGESVAINSVADYNSLTAIDDIAIVFPITINLANHKQVFVNNSQSLEELKVQCTEDDSDIECIDFEYPITLLLFNPNTNDILSREIDHDAALFQYMTEKDPEILMSIKYPIQLRAHTGQIVEISHNTDLEEQITLWANSCDEMD